VVEGLIAADNLRDLERVVASYTDDIVFLTPAGEVVEGRSAVRERYTKLFAEFELRLAVDAAEAQADGAWAFVRGRTHGELRPVGGGNSQRLDDNFLMILHCEGGSWKVARLMWSPRAAPIP
jgi:uncharacterized protein (TIGR02246 family)